MTRWDTDNLNAAHTVRELDQEWATVIDFEIGGGNIFADLGFENADLMALQSDNKGLRDRIEQIERELAEERGLCDRLAREAGNVDYMERPHCLDRAITDHRIRRGCK